jgi:catalase
MHYKPIAATADGTQFFKNEPMSNEPGVFTGQQPQEYVSQFVDGIANHRFWDRDVTV